MYLYGYLIELFDVYVLEFMCLFICRLRIFCQVVLYLMFVISKALIPFVYPDY